MFDLGWRSLLLVFCGSTMGVVVVAQGSSVSSFPDTSRSPFTIVVDGGSTGSRLHIFEFVKETEKSAGESSSVEVEAEEEDPQDDEITCWRRGSSRVDTPLSAFWRPATEGGVNATALALYLLPSLIYAARLVPPHYHAHTRVHYQATAGMRLLKEDQQRAIYDALYEGLLDLAPDVMVFRGLRREDLGTLSGELEGFYGAVAANYLAGNTNAQLELQPTKSSEHTTSLQQHEGPIGALDMGGSSTQLVFLPRQEALAPSSSRDVPAPCPDAAADVCTPTPSAVQRLEGEDFYSASYLGYGADQFRIRMWNHWVEQHQKLKVATTVVDNPCAFPGLAIEWERHTLMGTGDADLCIKEVQQMIAHRSEPDLENLGSQVGGVPFPPVHGKFFAMSLFYFSLDSLRHFSLEGGEALKASWPNPSIQELVDALPGLCRRDWKNDLSKVPDWSHRFTRREVLPHRCIESVYMVTLLRDGYGFAPESRDITFTFLVNGSEVEWSLGMALVLRLEAEREDAGGMGKDTAGLTVRVNHKENQSCCEGCESHPDVGSEPLHFDQIIS